MFNVVGTTNTLNESLFTSIFMKIWLSTYFFRMEVQLYIIRTCCGDFSYEKSWPYGITVCQCTFHVRETELHFLNATSNTQLVSTDLFDTCWLWKKISPPVTVGLKSNFHTVSQFLIFTCLPCPYFGDMHYKFPDNSRHTIRPEIKRVVDCFTGNWYHFESHH